jgi:multisubunit Na+/H+ antiporter MnhB subunit
MPDAGDREPGQIDDKPLPVFWAIGLPLFIGGLVVALGLILILTGFNIIDIYPELKHGPRWVISILGLPLFSWGIWIASGAFEGKKGENSITSQFARHFLILANLIPMAGIFLWGGFGPGRRNFQVETTIGSQSVTSSGNEFIGRLIFGGVGIFMAVIALLYIHTQFIRKKPQ